MNEILDGLMRHVREVAFSLRPVELDGLGLVAALRTYLEQVELVTGLECTWDCQVDDISFGQDATNSLFRITQEALTNITLHAGASRVKVGLYPEDGNHVLLIEDNGCGYDPAEVAVSRSLGLISMKERAEQVGGTFKITPKIDEGTTIEVRIPSR